MYLDDLNVENDYSDPDDSFDTIPFDLAENITLDGRLEMLYQFKKMIEKEPEFIGIHNISSYKIYNIIMNTNKPSLTKNSYQLTMDQLDIFKDLYNILELEKNDAMILDTVANKIMNVIYVK